MIHCLLLGWQSYSDLSFRSQIVFSDKLERDLEGEDAAHVCSCGLHANENIHLMFFVPYNLFHTHSLYKINIYITIRDTSIALKRKDTNHGDPDILSVMSINMGCLIHDKYNLILD